MGHYILRRRGLGNTSCKAVEALSTTGIKVVRNDRAVPADAQVVIRWGTTSNVGVPGATILNDTKAIHEVNNKAGFRKLLNDAKLCPKTWFNWAEHTFPCIIRPSHHAQGKQLYVCNTYDEVSAAVAKCDGGAWYASELIKKTHEYRVFVAQGRAVEVCEKHPDDPNAVAWNHAQGAHFENVRWGQWPVKVVEAAIKAFNLSRLDFGAVDVIVDSEGTAFVLEINTAPSLTSEYRQKCMTKVFDWMIERGKDRIPVAPGNRGYQRLIHPAIDPEARLAA